MLKKVTHTVGEKLTLDMVKSTGGNMPIARTEQGMICLLDRSKKYFCEYGSRWECEIIEVHEKKLIIKPVKMLLDAKTALEQATKELKSSDKVKDFSQKSQSEKFKAKYPYKTKQEMKQK